MLLPATVGNIFGTPVVEQVFSAVVTFLWVSSVFGNFRPFKAEFIFGNSQKSLETKLLL
jgi:hypothetical protein